MPLSFNSPQFVLDITTYHPVSGMQGMEWTNRIMTDPEQHQAKQTDQRKPPYSSFMETIRACCCKMPDSCPKGMWLACG